MKKQYDALQALRVAMHPDKTFIGKVKKGFDFLGFHLTPKGGTVSKAALSRHENKVARLYEQNAKPKRIRAYRLRWLVWATLSTAVLGQAGFASSLDTSGECELIPSGCTIPLTDSSTWYAGTCQSDNTSLLGGFQVADIGTPPEDIRLCFSSTAPTNPLSSSPCDITSTEVDTATNYMIIENTTIEAYCAYSYDLDLSAPAASRRTSLSVYAPTVVPTNIPVVGPFVLLAMIIGLAWFGNRRRNQ